MHIIKNTLHLAVVQGAKRIRHVPTEPFFIHQHKRLLGLWQRQYISSCSRHLLHRPSPTTADQPFSLDYDVIPTSIYYNHPNTSRYSARGLLYHFPYTSGFFFCRRSPISSLFIKQPTAIASQTSILTIDIIVSSTYLSSSLISLCPKNVTVLLHHYSVAVRLSSHYLHQKYAGQHISRSVTKKRSFSVICLLHRHHFYYSIRHF